MSNQNSTDRIFVSVSVSEFDGDIDALLARIDDQISSHLEADCSCRNVSVQSYRAPLYTQVSDNCPECRTTLELSEPMLDYDNGATVQAYCRDCGWEGTGEYRLIDLLGYSDDEPIDSQTRLRPVSLVATGSVVPRYLSYPDSSAYDS